MSSGRQALSVIGMAVAAYFSGGSSLWATAGGIVGGEIGGFIDGPPEGPRLDDLSAPQIEYGGKIGRLYGGPKWFDVAPLWASEKRETSEVVGGKGGDSGVEQFSYLCDFLLRVCESREGTPCEIVAVTGVEVDGQLVWTSLADASLESLANSAEQEIWSDMQVMLGHEDQAPWSVMEAAVGVENANAYRGYLTVGFSDFLLGDGGAPRRVRIQAITVGSQGLGNVFWLINGDGPVGSTTADDESSWNQTVVVGNMEQEEPARYGTTSFHNVAGATGSTYLESTINVPWTPDDDLTLEGDFYIGEDTNRSIDMLYVEAGGGHTIAAGIVDNVSPDQKFLSLRVFDQTVTGDVFGTGEYPVAFGNLHWELDYRGATHTATLRIAGAGQLALTYSGTPPSVTAWSTARAGYSASGSALSAGVFRTDGVRFTRYVLRHSQDFTPPDSAPTDDYPGAWTPGVVALQDILEYEATRCAPLEAANIDFSAAAGIDVECHVAIGSAAEAIQPLLTRFWFDLFAADKLYLVRRGGSVEQTIENRWTGAGNGGRSDPFAGLIRSNDVEVAKKKAITYSDMLKDGEQDTRTGDRESVGSDVDTLVMNLHMRPTEAQGLADTATADSRVGGHRATVRLGPKHGLLLQPGSVIYLTDHNGNTYRCLVLRVVWNRWVWECEVRLDDPAVLQAAGIAVDVDQRALTVAAPPSATLYVLDIPLLRVQDDGPGEYVLATQTGRFRGIDIFKSSDDVTYTNVGQIQQRGTAGVCDSTLPSFDGWGWDNSSVLTVTLDDGSGGTLSSATKTAIEANRALNLAAVGAHGRWELIQFATATLLTGTTYELRGLLRNLFGTEWANSEHEADDSFALLQANGMTRVPGSVADLGQTRYYKAVPRGRSRDSVEAVSIECEEQCLLPYAPTDVQNDEGVIRWNRRSRMEGAIGIDPPLGEVSERYDAELYDGVTLEDSGSGLTSAEWTPSDDPSGLTVRVYQMSDLVGRGHVAEKELT